MEENEIIEEVKTFTQEEVNEIIQKEKRRFEKSQISPEEFETLKNAKAKSEEDLNALKTQYETLANELNDSRNNSQLLESKANDIDYVKFKVLQTKAEAETFAEALDRFKNDNPQYFGEHKQTKANIQNTTQIEDNAVEEWIEKLRKERGR